VTKMNIKEALRVGCRACPRFGGNLIKISRKIAHATEGKVAQGLPNNVVFLLGYVRPFANSKRELLWLDHPIVSPLHIKETNDESNSFAARVGLLENFNPISGAFATVSISFKARTTLALSLPFMVSKKTLKRSFLLSGVLVSWAEAHSSAADFVVKESFSLMSSLLSSLYCLAFLTP